MSDVPVSTFDSDDAASDDTAATTLEASLDPVLKRLLEACVEAGASDLHLSPGRPPTARRDGVLVSFQGIDSLKPADTARFVRSMLGDRQRQHFAERLQLDFSFGLAGLGRFRVNVFRQRGTCALAIRSIPARIRSIEELGCPPGVLELITRPFGLVLVVGPTGSGKSTTQAAMIAHINATRPCHILTIEDPIEYLHAHGQAMVNQREVGIDVIDFADGLRSALREDPDVILVGEMRDSASISHALTLAETGHLVFATLHTNDAAQALDRIVDVFPGDRRHQVQSQLASTLQGVISQRLLPASNGGRVGAFEYLVATDAVRNLVRDGKTHQLRNVIVGGQADGMQTLEMDLAQLVADGVVSIDAASAASAFPREVAALATRAAAERRSQNHLHQSDHRRLRGQILSAELLGQTTGANPGATTRTGSR